jgi:5'-deoxynucleotidase YfbR-like HD superfamily hydrolase
MEEDAMHKIVEDLECKVIGNEILSLWLEYEEGITKEAILAHQLDKFEMITQAGIYVYLFTYASIDSYVHMYIYTYIYAYMPVPIFMKIT